MRDESLNEFISAEQAMELARRELDMLHSNKDTLFESFGGEAIGIPVLVMNLSKKPSYWLVPISFHDKVIGFARVLGNGRIAHIGTFIRTSVQIKEAPPTVTGIDASEATKRAAEKIDVGLGESVSEPIFVQDGPIGREAWFVEVIKDGRPTRWIFVTSAGTYERPAGRMLSENYF
jgi:hypothetical protein